MGCHLRLVSGKSSGKILVKNHVWRELGQRRKRKPRRAGEGREQQDGMVASEIKKVQETQGLAWAEHTAPTLMGPGMA